MTESKNHYTAKELAGLPGMPKSTKGIIEKATRDSWPSRPRQGKGGGREYLVDCLPAETREFLADQLIDSSRENTCTTLQTRIDTTPAVKAAPQLPDVGRLKKWQRQAMDARMYLLRLVEQAAPAIGVNKAIKKIVQKSDLDELAPIIARANIRGGKTGSRTITESTLMRWWSQYRAAGHYSVLAPKDMEKQDVPPWADYFLKVYRVPQKISIADAQRQLKKILPPEIPLPSVHQMERYRKKFSKLDIQRGRKSSKELLGQKSYVDRDTSKFNPCDICLCDGHSFKAYVAHPLHGRHFHPEVCAVLCAVTRVAIGWSAGLAESAQTVADAIRHAVTVTHTKPEACIPAILYTDAGAGNKAKVNADELTGLFGRLGVTFKTGIPGRSQARGRIERPQKSIWIRAAKELPTYTGKDMDSLVRRNVYLQLEKDVRESKTNGGKVESKILIPWQQFLDLCQETIDTYNRSEHSALPRISDPQTGRRRHMTPLEMWAQHLLEGWQPTLPEPVELDGLFRPQLQVPTRRGLVRIFGNSYHHTDLEHYHGETLHVQYDIHDASQVWVRDTEERLICIAKFEANKRDFYPVPVVEQAVEARRQRRLKTAERRIEEIELEAQGARDSLVPDRIDLPAEMEERADRVLQLAARRRERKPVATSFERYDDICDRLKAGDVTDYERQWMAEYDKFLVTGKKKGLVAADEFCTGSFDEAQEAGK